MALGSWMLCIGWFGFNVMSGATLDGITGLVAMNSLFAMAGGILVALVVSKNDPGFIHNGALAGLVALPCHSLLRHVSEAPRQADRSRSERQASMRGQFTATAALEGDTVLILDDVRVTGATLAEAARALIEAGAGRVVGLALAQASSALAGPLGTWGPIRPLEPAPLTGQGQGGLFSGPPGGA